MDLWAKKTTPEREDEETERLVRPLPKDKPPRHDRRRERVDSEADPDLSESDPDESKNYKDVGGSVEGTLDALLCRWAKAENIPVINVETGEPVPGGVSPETLKDPDQKSKYKVIKPEEAEKAKAEKGKAKAEKGKAKPKAEKGEGKPKADKPAEGEKGKAEKDTEESPEAKAKAEAEAEAQAKADEDRETSQQWTNKGRHKQDEFQRFLEAIPTNDPDEATGEVLVLNPKTKKKVPFDKLPFEAQANLINAYSEQKETEGLAKEERKLQVEASQYLAEMNPKVREVLDQLADPNSEASQKVAALGEKYDLKDIRPEKILPELKDLGVPEGLMSVAHVKQVVEAARTYDAMPERDKAGIVKVERREASEVEKDNAARLVVDTFPPEVSAEIIARDMHPDDVFELVVEYRSAKSLPMKDPAAFASRMSAIYETDPARIKPPKTWTKDGKEVDFKELSPEEQAAAYRRHQTQILAMSMAAKDQLSESLEMRNRRGDPSVPPEVASLLSTAMLMTDKSTEATSQMASAAYEGMLESGTHIPLGDKTVKALLKKLDPQAKRVAQAVLLANDYHGAKDEILGSQGVFSEWSSPRKITKGLKDVASYFGERAKMYGVDDPSTVVRGADPAKLFRARVLGRLSALNPDKHVQVQAQMGKVEDGEYDQAHKKWLRLHKKWLARKAKHDRKQMSTQPFGGAAPHLKGKIEAEPFSEPEPIEPIKPAGYGTRQGQGGASGRQQLDAVLERAGVSKKASRLAWRFLISTYPRCEAMGHDYDRTAVYHGVEPYADAPEPYAEWEQAHQRDLGEEDYEQILTTAQDWLKTPVLSENIEGIVRDQQLRAALDLAIQASKYNRAICPETYNMLLARLAGIPEPGPGHTLQTIQGSTCGNGVERAMQKSAMSGEARDLELYIDNTSDLSPQGPRGQGHDIVKNLLRKQKSGKYDKRLSVKLWMYLVESAGKRYHKEMGAGMSGPWHQLFPKKVREEVAKSLAEEFDGASKRGEYSQIDLRRGRAATKTPQGQGPGQATENAMTTKLSEDQSKKASEILGRYDKLAKDIQQNFASWGMDFEDARVAVNKLDAAADAFEKGAFGEASLQHRQIEVVAKVLQKDPDEPYMDAFQNIHQPHQTDGDEPYMGAYGDDESSAVETGKEENGEALAP
jgi:hypothetical protein